MLAFCRDRSRTVSLAAGADARRTAGGTPALQNLYPRSLRQFP